MFRIKKLDQFIAKQFLLLFVATLFICQFVLMMQFLWRYVDDLIGKGLSLEVLAQFFWYMGLMLIPQAFPLAILLSSLIAFGNLGESSELTAIKAAGVSLMQAMRPLIVITFIITGVSFYFQDVIGPEANKSFAQLLLSMKQKSPELEIPEGVFYSGIPNSNIYVQRKDLETGKLYGVMIYRQSGSWEDQAIILADSGMMQSTAEKKHLLLTLWNGEWFENMRRQDMGNSAEVPYRRETFGHKTILLDFDGDFSLADASGVSGSAKSKSLARIYRDLDSIRHSNDSIGRQYYKEAQYNTFRKPSLGQDDSLKALQEVAAGQTDIDTLYAKLTPEQRRNVMKRAAQEAQQATTDVTMKGDYAHYLHRQDRLHQLEAVGKITLALQCIIFFFIGAPLGAIIRKGGLGVPVIISVIVFIVYYIFDNSGMRMAREDEWTVWFGRWIPVMVLAPLAIFFTYKANNDSTVFNIDAYRDVARLMLGLRSKRNVTRKEVIISAPRYAEDIDILQGINSQVAQYAEEHKLYLLPNPVKVFFAEGNDHAIEKITNELEGAIEDLGNTRDKVILSRLNHYPVIAPRAHTNPFKRRWLNILTLMVLPLGIFFYLRIWRYRLRLFKDLHDVRQTSEKLMPRMRALADAQAAAQGTI